MVRIPVRGCYPHVTVRAALECSHKDPDVSHTFDFQIHLERAKEGQTFVATVKAPLRTPASHITAPKCGFQLLANAHPRRLQTMAQILRFLPPTWETFTEFWAPS